MINVGGINHVTLTVSDIHRSLGFYTQVLNFSVAVELSPTRIILSNNQLLLVISEPLDRAAMPANDRFSEHRIGLDHVSFSVENLAAMEQAAAELDQRGIPRGDIRDLSSGGVPIYVMAFRDPDNIQLELTASKQ